MKLWTVGLVTALLACSNSKDDMKAEMDRQAERNKDRVPTESEAVETKKLDVPTPVEKPKDEIPEPDPNDPKAVDEARKLAMISSRYKDVVRFCEMGKIDSKSDEQARLGCALAACNLKEVDRAKMWAKDLQKDLRAQAIKVCTPLGVTL